MHPRPCSRRASLQARYSAAHRSCTTTRWRNIFAMPRAFCIRTARSRSVCCAPPRRLRRQLRTFTDSDSATDALKRSDLVVQKVANQKSGEPRSVDTNEELLKLAAVELRRRI